MTRRPATRPAAGRQLAAAFPGDLLTGAPALGITADEDGAQLDLFEEVAALPATDDAARDAADVELLAILDAAPSGPVDWNVCIGYKTDEHAHPVAELRPSYLCPACDDHLSRDVATDRDGAARRTRPAGECLAGGHPAGSRWSTCLACFGD